MKEIKEQLEKMGYDYAVAIATKSEIENGAACGQLSIIVEDETEKIVNFLFNPPARSVKIGWANMGRLDGVTNVTRGIVEEDSSILSRPS